MARGKSFSPEFRQEAVRLYRVSGRPYRAVAEKLADGSNLPSCEIVFQLAGTCGAAARGPGASVGLAGETFRAGSVYRGRPGMGSFSPR